jgi:hypothetical protein
MWDKEGRCMDIYYIDEIMTDLFVPRLISAIKTSGYMISYGGIGGECDIMIYSKKSEIGNIKIQSRDFHSVIYLKTRSKKLKQIVSKLINNF